MGVMGNGGGVDASCWKFGFKADQASQSPPATGLGSDGRIDPTWESRDRGREGPRNTNLGIFFSCFLFWLDLLQ